MRGKEVPDIAGTAYIRITPACAGKREQGEQITIIFEDHPRMCGEKTKKEAKISGFNKTDS